MKNASNSSAAHFSGGIQANLAASGHHRVEQRRIGLADVAAEELDDADDLRSAKNGNRERAVQADPIGGCRAREITVDHDVRNPGGLPAGPHPTRQANAAGQGRRPAQLDEVREPVGVDRASVRRSGAQRRRHRLPRARRTPSRARRTRRPASAARRRQASASRPAHA